MEFALRSPQHPRSRRTRERWRLTVRLRQPHGNANPHGFDYEAWLLERGIGATGYVRPRGERVRLAEMVYRPGYVVERLRERIRTKLWDALPEHRYAGVVIALAIGDQRAIELGRLLEALDLDGLLVEQTVTVHADAR